jgi:hypothetical protein
LHFAQTINTVDKEGTLLNIQKHSQKLHIMSIVEDAREAAHRVGERMSTAAHRAADEAASVGRRIIDRAPAVDSVIDDVEVYNCQVIRSCRLTDLFIARVVFKRLPTSYVRL